MSTTYNRERWHKKLEELGSDVDLTSFTISVIDKMNSVDSWNKNSVAQEALFYSLKWHREDLSKIVVHSIYSDTIKIDIGMLNYLMTKLDSEALRIYSDLVDMTAADKSAEDYESFIYLFAKDGRRDDVMLCLQKGFKISGAFLFFTALKSSNFEDAKFYYQKLNPKIKPKKWDKFLGEIAYLCWDYDTISILNELETYNLEHPMIGYDPIYVMGQACQNSGIHIAEYLHNKGAPLFDKNAKKDPMVMARANPKVVRWLLKKGVSPNLHGDTILSVLCHKTNTEQLMLDIINQMNPENVPWLKMLKGAAGAEPKDCIPRIEFLKSIHEYSQKDFQKAYEKSSYFSCELWNPVREHFEKNCNVKTNGKTVINILKGFEGAQSKNAMRLLEKCVTFSQEEKDEMLWLSVNDIIRRGGKIQMVDKLLKIGANPKGREGETLKFIEEANRNDLKILFNNHLNPDEIINEEGWGVS